MPFASRAEIHFMASAYRCLRLCLPILGEPADRVLDFVNGTVSN